MQTLASGVPAFLAVAGGAAGSPAGLPSARCRAALVPRAMGISVPKAGESGPARSVKIPSRMFPLYFVQDAHSLLRNPFSRKNIWSASHSFPLQKFSQSTPNPLTADSIVVVKVLVHKTQYQREASTHLDS